MQSAPTQGLHRPVTRFALSPVLDVPGQHHPPLCALLARELTDYVASGRVAIVLHHGGNQHVLNSFDRVIPGV